MATYHVPVLEHFEWQQTVKDRLTSPPDNPSKGDRYIVDSPGSGAWEGHTTEIAYYTGSEWAFITPTEGFHTWVEDEDKIYVFTGAIWTDEASGTGDMLKDIYDADNDGRVDKAEKINDGTYEITAQQMHVTVTRKAEYESHLKVLTFNNL